MQPSENGVKVTWSDFESWRETCEWSRYISQLPTSNSILRFGNEAWSEDLIIFYSYTSPIEVNEAYLQPLLSFSSVITTFEIFR